MVQLAVGCNLKPKRGKKKKGGEGAKRWKRERNMRMQRYCWCRNH